MNQAGMTPEFLSTLAGSALSLAVAYIPGVSDWYATLDRAGKRLVMLALLVAAALACYGAACGGLTGLWGWPFPGCDLQGAAAVGRAFFAALVANQATFLIARPTGS